MPLFLKISTFFKMLVARKREVIYTCLENNIPLTDENIVHVIDIINQRKKNDLLTKKNENSNPLKSDTIYEEKHLN